MSNYTKSTNFATKDNLTPGDPLKVVRGTEIDTEFNNIATAVATKTDNSAAAITGGSITGITDLAIADGGTGASTATAALNNLLPSQTSNANKYLQTDGTNATWDAVTLSTADITGTLPVANGGTGVTSSTGTGSVVLSNSPTLVTPALGTPASGVATNLTGLPISTGVSGLGTGVATFLGTPSSANLISAVTDETGTGSLVFANSPTLVTPALGTPSALVGTNITGTASGLTAGNVTTNANLTGAVTSVGNATSLGSFSSANLLGALTDETGTGSAVFATSPTLITPILGTPTSATLTNATGLPIATGVSGLGTGVATALAVNVGSAGAPVVNGGALGTPSSGTVTNLTGTASININGTVGATTATTGAFTTLAASGAVTLSGGTANGVTYLNGSKVLTSGSALTFDGTNLTNTSSSVGTPEIAVQNSATSAGANARLRIKTGGSGATTYGDAFIQFTDSLNWNWSIGAGSSTSNALTFNQYFGLGSNELMRLTSTGLGIGTSSPSQKLTVSGGIASVAGISALTASSAFFDYNSGNGRFAAVSSTTGTAAPITFSQYSSNGSVGRDAVTIDSAGNLGLGVTPSAWASMQPALEIGGYGSAIASWGTNRNLYVLSNIYYDGTASAFKYTTTATASAVYYNASGEAGTHAWFTAGAPASRTAGGTAAMTQAMTLSASGGLGVGETSIASDTRLHLKHTTDNCLLKIQSSYSPILRLINGGGSEVSTIDATGNNVLTFQTGSSERARIDSSGNLLVGDTTNSRGARLRVEGIETAYFTGYGNGYGIGLWMTPNASASGGTATAISFQNVSNTTVGSITTTASATAYNTSSDYRLKNTIAPMTGALAKVALLKPCTYKWNSNGSDGQGFIAHELAEVVPQCVTGAKDGVDEDGNPKYQGIDTSFLVATLTAALQEQQAIIESLKARLDAANL